MTSICGAALIGIVVASVACAGGNRRRELLNDATDADPSREDLIQAVRQSVNGKEYSDSVTRTESVPHQEMVSHSCSQYDVDVDPNAKRNPELARCPRVGATYTRPEVVYTTETKRVTEVHRCQSLPGPESGWSVARSGNDVWTVSHAGSSWEVEKLKGNRIGSAESIQFARFSFEIRPRQRC